MLQRSMLILRMPPVFSKNPKYLQKYFSNTHANCLNQKWRQANALPLNPNACGMLTDGPDYSFSNGTSTPFGVGQQKRIIKQQQITEQIIHLTAEVDFAVERCNILHQEKTAMLQSISNKKLQSKGLELLKKKS